jgi:CBS domain containing-hemolysin-like protein
MWIPTLRQIQPTKLEAIPVGDKMISLGKLTLVRTPADDAQTLDSILTKFSSLGLSRIPVLDANDLGVGVLHDSTISRFVIDQGKLTPPVAPTLAASLADPAQKQTLAASVVYVAASMSLSEVKKAMDAKSKTSNISCRDVFVTDTGQATGKVIGYLADIDIANLGAFG